MTPSLKQEELDKLLYFLKGNKQALLLCLDVVYVGHWFDDMIDLDNPRPPQDAKVTFLKCFARIPDNPFFKKWQPYLHPILVNTAQLYIDSTEMEFGDGDDRLMAFILRNQSLAFINHCIYCAGLEAGEPGWVTEVGPDFWRLFKLKDKFLEFLEDTSLSQTVEEEE